MTDAIAPVLQRIVDDMIGEANSAIGGLPASITSTLLDRLERDGLAIVGATVPGLTRAQSTYVTLSSYQLILGCRSPSASAVR